MTSQQTQNVSNMFAGSSGLICHRVFAAKHSNPIGNKNQTNNKKPTK